MLKRLPLSVKIALLATLILVGSSLTVSFATYTMVRNSQLRELDQRLYNTANGISRGGLSVPGSDILPSLVQGDFYVRFVIGNENTVRVIPPGINVNGDTINIYSPPTIVNETSDYINQIFDASSETAYNAETLLFQNPGYLPLITADTVINVKYVDWRVISVDTSLLTESKGTKIFLALPTDNIQTSLRDLTVILTWTCLSVLTISVALTWLLVRFSLRPLRNIRASAQKIASRQDYQASIQDYIPVTSPSTTEIGSLQQSLNLMLQKINLSFDRQSQTQRQMRKFISDSSHELRTPLSIILGYIELYQTGMIQESQDVKELLSKVATSAERMKYLVNDLITLTRLDEGEKLNLMPTDPWGLLKESADNLQALTPERPIDLVKLSDANVQPILIDPQRIHQVLTNIIGNINRYTDADVPVQLTIEQNSQTTMMKIIDHGPGVPDATYDHLFERFYVLADSRSRSISGSGLGLAIAKSIVELHQGQIFAEPTPEHGLTITIILKNH